MIDHTSCNLSLALNLATRSCVVTGVLCTKTVLISSSVTGPLDDVGSTFTDGVPFEGVLLLEADAGSSLVETFCS